MTPPGYRPGALIVTVPFAPFHTRRPAVTKIFPGPLPISAPSLITLKERVERPPGQVESYPESATTGRAGGMKSRRGRTPRSAGPPK